MARIKLELRRLEDGEMPLALSLAASIDAQDDPKCEAWGVAAAGSPPPGSEGWGIFEQDSLAGVAWLRRPEAGVVEIAAMVLPRRRWGTGLVLWVMGELEFVEEGALREIRFTLENGGPSVGEQFEDMGFSRSSAEEESYPRGAWQKLIGGVAKSGNEPGVVPTDLN